MGTTHLAVWLSHYLTGVQQKRVVVLEWNNHGDFARMGQFCTAQKKTSGVFRILEVDYVEAAGAGELAACLNAEYHYIIVDFGEITETGLAECVRCDRKVMVGSMSEWQAGVFLEEAGRAVKREKGWSYVTAFGSEETRREWEKMFRCPCLRIPVSEDAFAVTRTDMVFFETLLK